MTQRQQQLVLSHVQERLNRAQRTIVEFNATVQINKRGGRRRAIRQAA